MKNLIILIITFILIFSVSNIITYQHQSSFDGSDYTGWPVRYYEYFGGLCADELSCPRGKGFMPTFLIIDFLIILAISLSILYLKNILIKQKV